MATSRLTGQFYCWNEKGYGFLYITPQQRFFVHISQIRFDHVPVVGEKVTFVPGPPRKEGPDQLPLALDVQAIEGVL